MEAFIVLGLLTGAFALLGVLALFFGADSRDGWADESMHRGITA